MLVVQTSFLVYLKSAVFSLTSSYYSNDL